MITMPPLPYEPESLEQMKARFREAFGPRYINEEIMAGRGIPPSKLRAHVFDFPDSMRMIVSVDVTAGHELVHFSFSQAKPVTSEREYRLFWARMHDRVTALVGREVAPVETGTTTKVVHLFFRPQDFSEFMMEIKTVAE